MATLRAVPKIKLHFNETFHSTYSSLNYYFRMNLITD